MGEQTVGQEQVTCGCGAVTLERGRIVTKGYCHDCNTLLEWKRGKPAVTPMVPRVDSDVVKGTRLYQMLHLATQSTTISQIGQIRRVCLPDGLTEQFCSCLTDEGSIIMSALQQAGTTEPTADAMLDALDHALHEHDYRFIADPCNGWTAGCYGPTGLPQVKCEVFIRDLAKAILAQAAAPAGCADDHRTNLGDDCPTPEGCACVPGGGLCPECDHVAQVANDMRPDDDAAV